MSNKQTGKSNGSNRDKISFSVDNKNISIRGLDAKTVTKNGKSRTYYHLTKDAFFSVRIPTKHSVPSKEGYTNGFGSIALNLSEYNGNPNAYDENKQATGKKNKARTKFAVAPGRELSLNVATGENQYENMSFTAEELFDPDQGNTTTRGEIYTPEKIDYSNYSKLRVRKESNVTIVGVEQKDGMIKIKDSGNLGMTLSVPYPGAPTGYARTNFIPFYAISSTDAPAFENNALKKDANGKQVFDEDKLELQMKNDWEIAVTVDKDNVVKVPWSEFTANVKQAAKDQYAARSGKAPTQQAEVDVEAIPADVQAQLDDMGSDEMDFA